MPAFDYIRQHKQLVNLALSAAEVSGFIDPDTPLQYPPDLQLEPVHLDIDLQIDIAGEQANCQVTTTVIAHGNQPNELILDALDFEDVMCPRSRRSRVGLELRWPEIDYSMDRFVYERRAAARGSDLPRSEAGRWSVSFRSQTRRIPISHGMPRRTTKQNAPGIGCPA